MIGVILAVVDWLRRFRQQQPPQPDRPLEREHHVYASSFADYADVMAFRRCKARGGTDQECFAVGDNGIGFWNDDTTGPAPMCALPPEDMIERWGSVDAAKHKLVSVTVDEHHPVICMLADKMPHRVHIRNGAGIDLSPAACRALDLIPPVMVRAVWRWV